MTDLNVWENTVDNGKYKCWVERVDGYTGILNVTCDGRIILREQVRLAYQAMFGPDVSDLTKWQHQVLQAIDADYLARGEKPPE